MITYDEPWTEIEVRLEGKIVGKIVGKPFPLSNGGTTTMWAYVPKGKNSSDNWYSSLRELKADLEAE